MSTRSLNLFKLLIMTATMTFAGAIFAQEQDKLLSNTETILNSDDIDIQANYYQPEEKTPEEMIEDAQAKAETENTKMIAKEISNIKVPRKQVTAIKKEQAKTLSSKIAKLFGGTSDVSNSSADATSTTQTSQTTPEVETKSNISLKIMPSFGVLNIKGDGIDFESKFNGSILVESMVSKRIALGVTIGYSSLTMTDVSSNSAYYNNGYGYQSGGTIIKTIDQNGQPVNMVVGSNGSTSPYGYSSSSAYTMAGRDLSYNHLLLELSSKFYIAVESRVRPYLGLGLGYNRTSLSYDDQAQTSTVQASAASSKSSYLSGAGILGTDINFTQNFGINAEIKYAKGLTSGSARQTLTTSTDQQVLDSVGTRISEADFFSVTGGVVISF